MYSVVCYLEVMFCGRIFFPINYNLRFVIIGKTSVRSYRVAEFNSILVAVVGTHLERNFVVLAEKEKENEYHLPSNPRTIVGPQSRKEKAGDR